MHAVRLLVELFDVPRGVSDDDVGEDGVGLANIGDTKLYIEGAGPEHVEKRVRVEVTEFDESASVGRGTLRSVVGESSYTE